jgi:hypothetical protein
MSPRPSGKVSRISRETPEGVAADMAEVRARPDCPRIDADARGGVLAVMVAFAIAKPPASPGEVRRQRAFAGLLRAVEDELAAGRIAAALAVALAGEFERAFAFAGAVERGHNRAAKMHGEADADTLREWQKIMDEIAAKPGMGRSRAWAEVGFEANRRRPVNQKTLERHGVINPIPAKRGPQKKLPIDSRA